MHLLATGRRQQRHQQQLIERAGLEEFVDPRKTLKELDVGIGCAIGLRRMMRISRGVTEAELEHTVNWHFTLDGLQAASDRVLRLMDRLLLPNLARRLPDQLHTFSDGQKFEVRVDSLNANYSLKYFAAKN